MEKTEWKVFEFAKDGLSYTVKATDKESARKFLLEEHDVDIRNCFQVPESEWDIPRITVYEDNDFEKESFLISIREAFNDENEMELLSTNDGGIVD